MTEYSKQEARFSPSAPLLLSPYRISSGGQLVYMGGIYLLCKRKPLQGSLAEWLGTGLQNRLRRFDSARNLKSKSSVIHLRMTELLPLKPSTRGFWVRAFAYL